MSGEEVKILFALCSTLAISKDTYSDRKAHLSMGSIRLNTGLERKKPSEKKEDSSRGLKVGGDFVE